MKGFVACIIKKLQDMSHCKTAAFLQRTADGHTMAGQLIYPATMAKLKLRFLLEMMQLKIRILRNMQIQT